MRQYRTIKELATMMSCHERTVRRIITEMQRSGAYPSECFMLRLKRVDEAAFIDFCGREKK